MSLPKTGNGQQSLKWLRLLLNHIPDKYEHLVRYYGYYSNRSRGARRRAELQCEEQTQTTLDDRPPNRRCKANRVRLIHKVYAVDPLKCPNCGAIMRIMALIDEPAVIERILKHLKAWNPGPAVAFSSQPGADSTRPPG